MASTRPTANPLDAWRDFITSLYPDALTRTYCVPPLQFNRVPYRRETVPGGLESAFALQHASDPVPTLPTQGSAAHGRAPPNVLWAQEPPTAKPMRVQESDYYDDFCQNHVVTNLQVLGERQQEAMFILSQLKFGDYLNKPAYAAAVAQLQSSLPKPTDLYPGQPKLARGETDVIVFHRRYGILIGELKSVGRWHLLENKELLDSTIKDKIEKAVEQLNKAQTVIKHVIKDIALGVTVKGALFLPYVSSERLRNVLTSNPQIAQDLCQCLGASSQTNAVDLCVCADQLSDPDTYWDVNEEALLKLPTWWRHRMAVEDGLLCGPGGDLLYLNIVARFVGPASTIGIHCAVSPRVEVRTIGEAVAELGQRLSRLVLTPQQLDILTRDPPFAHVHGPPGTGKTVLLVLQGLRWLLQGYDVQILSTEFSDFSASSLIQNQLQVTVDAYDPSAFSPGRVRLHSYDFSQNVDHASVALSDLTEAVRSQRLCILMDEMDFDNSIATGQARLQLLQELLKLQADDKLSDLRMWSSGLDHTDIPAPLQLQQVSTPLRSAPVIIREIQPALRFNLFSVKAYNSLGLPAPGSGPAVQYLNHSGHGHTSRWPVECQTCGLRVAETLKSLRVGQAALITAQDTPLAWRDFFILTRSSELRDAGCDEADDVPSAACGLVQGLRQAGVPVRVLSTAEHDRDPAAWQQRVSQVAAASEDEVTVAHFAYVTGLERRVVVWVKGWMAGPDDEDTTENVDAEDRLHIVTRCTTQLVVLDRPREDMRQNRPTFNLSHVGADDPNHTQMDCEQCGEDLGTRFQGWLDSCAVAPDNPSGSREPDTVPLTWSDFLIITTCPGLREKVTNGQGEVTAAASGVVRGLRKAGVPVLVLAGSDGPDWQQRIEQAAGSDQLIVADRALADSLSRTMLYCLDTNGQQVQLQCSQEGSQYDSEDEVLISIDHSGEGHSSPDIVSCPTCGRDMATQLRGLVEGESDDHKEDSSDDHKEGDVVAVTDMSSEYDSLSESSPLQWSDILITTSSLNLRDEEIDAQGHVTSQASGFVCGLRSQHIRVCVLAAGDESTDGGRGKGQTAAAGAVVVAHVTRVSGLQRRVVLTIDDQQGDDDDQQGDDDDQQGDDDDEKEADDISSSDVDEPSTSHVTVMADDPRCGVSAMSSVTLPCSDSLLQPSSGCAMHGHETESKADELCTATPQSNVIQNHLSPVTTHTDRQTSRDVNQGQQTTRDVSQGQQTSRAVNQGQQTPCDVSQGQTTSCDVSQGQQTPCDVRERTNRRKRKEISCSESNGNGKCQILE